MYLRTNNYTNQQGYSTHQNENSYKTTLNQQSQAIKIKLDRHQQLISDIVRELKQKVNKSQFLSGLGSKVSLSDITNISFENQSRDESLKLDQSFCRVSQQFQERLVKQKKNMQEQLQNIRLNVKQQQRIIKEQFQKQNKKEKTIIQQVKAFIRQQNQSFLQFLEKKGDRSQLDKIMHLTSLLAIQFELIKKRFSNFQVDYNLIWKQISNIYSTQQGLKSVLETEEKLKSLSNTVQKDLLKPLKKRRNSACVATLFKQLIGTVQRQQKHIKQLDDNGLDYLQKLRRQIQHMKRQQQNRNYSLNIFNDKLVSIEERHQKLQQRLTQICSLKRQYQTAKKDIEHIYQDYQMWKQETKNLTKIQISKQMQLKNYEIKSQIKEACQQISVKLVEFFQKCAKQQQIHSLQEQFRLFQRKFIEKNDNFQCLIKKVQENFSINSDYLQDKIKVMQKDINLRLKTAQFQAQKTSLVTMKEANNLIKKVETSYKKDLGMYEQQQKEINQLLCSQNIVARWIWTSGELKGGNLVVWDKQIINTLPQNFIHFKNEYCIRIKSTGIYRFQIGFYAKKKPNIQILVNGQTIISAVNNNSYVLHHSSGRLKDISTTQVTGLTYYDFFTFQEDSRLSIAYNGQKGHGFISLQRL